MSSRGIDHMPAKEQNVPGLPLIFRLHNLVSCGVKIGFTHVCLISLVLCDCAGSGSLKNLSVREAFLGNVLLLDLLLRVTVTFWEGLWLNQEYPIANG